MKHSDNAVRKSRCPRKPPCAFRGSCRKIYGPEDAIFCRDYCVLVTKGEHPEIDQGVFRKQKGGTGGK